jgi:hypothetical protein
MDVFVFGSNLAGRHGAGSAKAALREHGAVYGQGEGLQGRSYAIPTKDRQLRTLSITEVAAAVRRFIDFAKSHPEMTFNVVKVGCGLAGFRENEMIPFFRFAPANCRLPEGWRG